MFYHTYTCTYKYFFLLELFFICTDLRGCVNLQLQFFSVAWPTVELCYSWTKKQAVLRHTRSSFYVDYFRPVTSNWIKWPLTILRGLGCKSGRWVHFLSVPLLSLQHPVGWSINSDWSVNNGCLLEKFCLVQTLLSNGWLKYFLTENHCKSFYWSFRTDVFLQSMQGDQKFLNCRPCWTIKFWIKAAVTSSHSRNTRFP